MIFNSLSFFPFFLGTLLAYYFIRNWVAQKCILILASYLFYGLFNASFVLLLGGSTVFTWLVAEQCSKTKSRLWLAIGVGAPLLLLTVFKYAMFLQENTIWLVRRLDADASWTIVNIFLPVGVSFYLFQTLSYVIDVYRGQRTSTLLDYFLYVSFFPQLVAGPIVRASDFLPQTRDSSLGSPDHRKISWGLTIFFIGLFQKMILADAIFAGPANAAFAQNTALSFIDAWTGVLAFTGQIYFDFAGYSTCAIGVALCFGYRLPINFRYPYAAVGFSDFWKRWHISLSSWLRDYLYISLGGNRGGRIETYRNLMLTMLLGGLWHGAAWTFVAWGSLHGLYLVGERLLKRFAIKPSAPAIALGWLTTFLLTVIAWVPFRAQSFADAWRILGAMFAPKSIDSDLYTTQTVSIVAAAIVGAVSYSWFMRRRTFADFWSDAPLAVRALILAVAIVGVVIWRGAQSEFIYFQF